MSLRKISILRFYFLVSSTRNWTLVKNFTHILRNILVYIHIIAQPEYLVLARHEAMTDLINVMGRLVDSKGKILVPGISDQVSAVTQEEEMSYGPIDFDMVSL